MAAPKGQRTMPDCVFCGEPLGQDRNAPGSLPRVEVRDKQDIYVGGTVEAIFHRKCWPIVAAAIPLLKLLHDQGITDATAFVSRRARELAAEAPTQLRSPYHEPGYDEP